MNFFSNKTLQKTIGVLMLLVVCLMMVPQGVGANTPGSFDTSGGGARTGSGMIPGQPSASGNQGGSRMIPGQTPLNGDPSGSRMIPGETPLNANPAPSKDFCNFGFFEKGTYASQVTTCMSYIMLSTSGYFLYFAGIAFNFILDYTLNMPKFIEQFNIIDVGWGAFRDISLVFFVFIILFIAINMIVGKEAFGSKKLLSQVIVAAILINFSLFFTKAMVDASNILALQFYTKIVQNSTDSLVAGGNQQYLNDSDSGISAAFAHAMGLDQIWSAGTQGNAVDIQASAQRNLDWLNILTAGIFGSVFILVTAVVFLAGAIMMLVRTLVLIFLMIMSPFAWIGGILPMTKEISSKWWSALTSNLMYAPVYMMLMYVVMSMIIGRGNRTVDFLGMFTGSGIESTAATAFTFVVLNALMIGCILVANKAGAAGAGMASGISKKAIFGTAAAIGLGGTGMIARNTIGRGAAIAADKMASSKFAGSYLGRKTMGALKGTANATFDARNTELSKKASLGSGAKNGFMSGQEEKDKKLTEYGKSLSGVAKTTFAEKQFGGAKPSLGGLIMRSNRVVGSKLALESIEEKAKENKDKINELINRPDVKEYRDLIKKQRQGRLTPEEENRRNRLMTEIDGSIKLIDNNGDEVDLREIVVAEDPATIMKGIDQYKKDTSKKYSDAKKSKGFK
jgi:hypothetical protein